MQYFFNREVILSQNNQNRIGDTIGLEPTFPYDKNGIFQLYGVLPFTPSISLFYVFKVRECSQLQSSVIVSFFDSTLFGVGQTAIFVIIITLCFPRQFFSLDWMPISFPWQFIGDYHIENRLTSLTYVAYPFVISPRVVTAPLLQFLYAHTILCILSICQRTLLQLSVPPLVVIS